LIGIIYLFLGILILYFTGNWLVSGSTSLAKHLNVQPFIIALTLVAFGTSAPELAISVNSALKGYSGITIGNIVGSNIANVLFAIPLAFLIKIPKSSDVKKIDCLYLVLATVFFIFVFLKVQFFSFHSGVLMILMLLTYLAYVIFEAVKGKRAISTEDITTSFSLKKSMFFLFIGLIGVVVGADILVKGATMTASLFGISQTIIGLTIVAIGTSIPEVVTSMIAAYRGQTGFILGAILGSNFFNLLAVTGVASIITRISAENTLNNIDIIYLILSTIIFTLIAFYTKFLNKKLVSLILISYIIYVLFIYIRMT